LISVDQNCAGITTKETIDLACCIKPRTVSSKYKRTRARDIGNVLSR
jgi:hypothetical protein